MHFNLEFFLTLATLISGLMLLAQRFMCSKRGLLYSFVETGGSLFIVFLLVLIIRSFVIEPFRIPSGSMLPTLEVGDFILVNKYQYGLRLPVFRNQLLEWGEPDRGDIVVFKYPKNPQQDFIKRIVGLPGDRIKYQGKKLYINGARIPQRDRQTNIREAQETYTEDLFDASYRIRMNDNFPSLNNSWEVPQGHYFVMGDNRDNSNDSRSWGFVPDSSIVGRAFLIWLHWNWGIGEMDTSRIGKRIQ